MCQCVCTAFQYHFIFHLICGFCCAAPLLLFLSIVPIHFSIVFEDFLRNSFLFSCWEVKMKRTKLKRNEMSLDTHFINNEALVKAHKINTGHTRTQAKWFLKKPIDNWFNCIATIWWRTHTEFKAISFWHKRSAVEILDLICNHNIFCIPTISKKQTSCSPC